MDPRRNERLFCWAAVGCGSSREDRCSLPLAATRERDRKQRYHRALLVDFINTIRKPIELISLHLRFRVIRPFSRHGVEAWYLDTLGEKSVGLENGVKRETGIQVCAELSLLIRRRRRLRRKKKVHSVWTSCHLEKDTQNESEIELSNRRSAVRKWHYLTVHRVEPCVRIEISEIDWFSVFVFLNIWQHQRRICGPRTADSAEDLVEADTPGGHVPHEGTTTVRSGQSTLPDPWRNVQQPEEAALGFGSNAVPSFSGAGVHRRCRGNQVSFDR